ncbi:MAG: hypothetical protein GY842_27355 [bacterium]|nr:hypothetical protein [bacterium]
MTIQFQCPACAQPIEIDPEWAGQAVACPYCRKSVAAPRESTFQTPANPPTARPAGGARFSEVDQAGTFPPTVAAKSGNAVAVWALVLSLSCLACLITGNVVVGMHWDEMEPILEMQESGKSYAELNQEMLDHFQEGVPGWLMALGFLLFLALGFWVGGVVCGFMGLRHLHRRNYAIASLAVAALVLMLTLAGS